MRVFLLPTTFNGESYVNITGKEYNYLVNALRLKKGQKLMGRDCTGGLWDLTIEEINKKNLILSATKTQTLTEYTDTLPQESPLRTIILYQCLPKGRKTNDIIKKATEAGVKTIVLVKSKNCVADFTGKEDSKLSRYDAVIKEAIQQSGSTVPTTVEGPIDISQVPANFQAKAKGKPSLGLMLHQCKVEENQKELVSCISSFKKETQEGITGLLVGSEGGFTDTECETLLNAGFNAVLLKTNILRCETASIYAIGAIQTLLETSCV